MALDATPDGAVYTLAPGVRVSREDDDRLVIHGEQASVELSGASADLFESEIVPRLDGTTDVAGIARQAGLRGADDLSGLLDELNRAGILLRGGGDAPCLDYLEMLGVDRDSAAERLSGLRVTVIGRGALADAICTAMGGIPAKDVQRLGDDPAQLEEAALIDALKTCDFVFSAYGAAFAAVDHRVNRAIHATGTPALFCRLGVAKSVLGPLVIAGETPCFTCWQMRALACADNFAERMALEEEAAARTEPVASPAGEQSYLAMPVAGMAVAEMLKCTLGLGQPACIGQVMEYEPFRSGWTTHPLLHRHDCPVCSKKNFNLQGSRDWTA